MVWIPLLFIIVFNYVPMITGFSVAFKDYKPGLGIVGPLGWPEAFRTIFMTDDTMRALRNITDYRFHENRGKSDYTRDLRTPAE